MKKRIAVIALATAALLATSVAATAKPAGKKLGGTLKVVAWEGYTENQWVKPFEKQTGCTVQHQYAGSSDEMYNLMKKNAGYDLVSASGDASNRLIASGLVQPIDPSTIPNWKQLTPQLDQGPEPLRRRQVLRAALAVGPERADVEHGQVHGRRRTPGRPSTTPRTRARSRSRTTRSRSPTRRSTCRRRSRRSGSRIRTS